MYSASALGPNRRNGPSPSRRFSQRNFLEVKLRLQEDLAVALHERNRRKTLAVTLQSLLHTETAGKPCNLSSIQKPQENLANPVIYRKRKKRQILSRDPPPTLPSSSVVLCSAAAGLERQCRQSGAAMAGSGPPPTSIRVRFRAHGPGNKPTRGG